MTKSADETEWLRCRDEWQRAGSREPTPVHPDDIAAIASARCIHYRKVHVWDETGPVGIRWVIDLLLDTTR